jgi:hypothetical protein
MAAGEAERLHLYEIARDRWGDDEAARTLMDFLPSGSDDFATTHDIDLLRTETRSGFRELDQSVDARIAGMRADLLQRMNEQTRTLLLANITMWLSIVALLIGLRFS